MYPGEFETLFRKIANLFTLESIAEKNKLDKQFPKRNPNCPIWDCIELAETCDFIDIGNESIVSCKFFFKKPVRILFFILITEFETRLFRILEMNGNTASELNEKNLNDLIRELVDSDLIKLQKEYTSRQEFKEDLKAISSFRNIIVHANKKLEKTINAETVINRKKQMFRLLNALQQISDRMPLSE